MTGGGTGWGRDGTDRWMWMDGWTDRWMDGEWEKPGVSIFRRTAVCGAGERTDAPDVERPTESNESGATGVHSVSLAS